MKILIYGAGGVGGYFGGKLANANNEVSMIARGAHLKAINKNGLEIESINGNFKVRPKLATSDITEVETPDLVILGVKSWQIPKVAEELKPIIEEKTMVLPLQNGANNVESLLKILPCENVLAGLCFIVSFIDEPGKIKHAAFEPRIVFGEINNTKTKRIKLLKEVFKKADIDILVPENIQLEIWKKFLFITTVSGLGGLTRTSIDRMRKSDYLYGLMQKTAREVKAVANAKGIDIVQDHIETVFQLINKQGEGSTASTQRDIMAGKPSELENFNGFIVREGAKLNVENPINKFIYECLKPMEVEARKGQD